MRVVFLSALLLSALPAHAGCRLAWKDCKALYREMTVEAYAEVDDERHFRPAGLTRDERRVALENRHFDRIDERSTLLPSRIANEWMRLEACINPRGVASPSCYGSGPAERKVTTAATVPADAAGPVPIR